MLTSLLVPLDGSDLAERIIPFAAQMASSAKARIILAHARVPRLNGDSIEFALRAVAERLRVDGIAVDVCMIDIGPGDVGEAVAAVAREHQVNLVVMSAHGHGGIGADTTGPPHIRSCRRSKLQSYWSRPPVDIPGHTIVPSASWFGSKGRSSSSRSYARPPCW